MADRSTYGPLRERLARSQPLILDGAIGTEILRRDVTWADHQNLARPDVIRALHVDYLRAGADVISTNTFQLTKRSLENHFRDRAHLERVGVPGLTERPEASLRAAVKLCQEARTQAAGPASGRPRPVAIAGAITTIEWCFRPDLAPSRDEAGAEYRELIGILADAGCDLVLVETVNSIEEAVVALEAANHVGIPAWVAFVPNQDGQLFTGETMARAAAALAPLRPDAILLNCAPPDHCLAGLRALAPHSPAPTGVYPHVGRFDPPEWMFTDEYPPARYLDEARKWRDLGSAILGGCCGTTPEHIGALARAFRPAPVEG
ncbi:MAG TPA: homocysteine S-methyltransferase family protein [Chloroflexota bacterium]|nr:homocysteine S-methyltransferase family protein [Chloroflexota bacterium]